MVRVAPAPSQTPAVKQRWVGPVRPLDCAITLRFVGQQPSGKNQMGIRPVIGIQQNGKVGSKLHRFPRKPFEVWRDAIRLQFEQQRAAWAMYFPLREFVTVFIRYVASDRIGRDVPGLEDALWHVFERVRLVANDRYFQDVVFVQLPINRQAPEVRVEIVPVSWAWDIRRSWVTPCRLPGTGEFVLPDRGLGCERSVDETTDGRTRGTGGAVRESRSRVGVVRGESQSGVSDATG